jgi:hypothetical protein
VVLAADAAADESSPLRVASRSIAFAPCSIWRAMSATPAAMLSTVRLETACQLAKCRLLVGLRPLACVPGEPVGLVLTLGALRIVARTLQPLLLKPDLAQAARAAGERADLVCRSTPSIRMS